MLEAGPVCRPPESHPLPSEAHLVHAPYVTACFINPPLPSCAPPPLAGHPLAVGVGNCPTGTSWSCVFTATLPAQWHCSADSLGPSLPPPSPPSVVPSAIPASTTADGGPQRKHSPPPHPLQMHPLTCFWDWRQSAPAGPACSQQRCWLQIRWSRAPSADSLSLSCTSNSHWPPATQTGS